jgi:DNA-binding CsgD family transcriptional regulator
MTFAHRTPVESTADDLPPELTLPRFASETLDERLGLAIRVWQLSPRLAETLLLLVTGLSNQEIAICRGRSLLTIECQVGALLRRADVDSTDRLAAKFWLGLEDDAPAGPTPISAPVPLHRW